MWKRYTRTVGVIGAIYLATLFPQAKADSLADFYKGKQVIVYIGYAIGGGYDLYGRLVARHIGRHLPGNPTVVPQNMPGAGSLRLANYLFTVAPKDGTVMGTITQSTPQEEALGTPGITYRSAEFNWIGRVTSNVEINVVWNTWGIRSIADAKTREVVLAGTGPTTPSEVFPKVLNGVVGTKFKVIAGYGGSAEGVLAMERGETMGALLSWASMKASKQDWIRENKVTILVQYAMQRHPDLPNVPTIVDLGETEADRKILSLYASGADIGRAIVAPPKVPAERVTALRSAFDAMLKDRRFLEEIEKANLEFDPMSGEKLQKLVVQSTNIPPELLERAKAVRNVP